MTAVLPIEIVGGGLAGLSLGLALRRAGVDVTVIEAGSYPRHRVCGEFITGLDQQTIARLDLAPILADALRHHEVAWFIDERPARIQRLPAPALGLSRFTLDARLADAFTAAGGNLRTQTRCEGPLARPGRVCAIGRRRGRSSWLGLKVHVRDLTVTRDLEVHLGREAYVGLSRVEDGAVNVCGLFRRRTGTGSETRLESAGSLPTTARPAHTILFEYLRHCHLARLADRLESAAVESASFSAVAALDFHRRAPAEDEIRIGDAWAMIPPFTGNGMAMAFQSAADSVDPLCRYAQGLISWSAVCRHLNAALQRRFRLRLASAGILHPFLLQPARQQWLQRLSHARLLPFRPLYAALH